MNSFSTILKMLSDAGAEYIQNSIVLKLKDNALATLLLNGLIKTLKNQYICLDFHGMNDGIPKYLFITNIGSAHMFSGGFQSKTGLPIFESVPGSVRFDRGVLGKFHELHIKRNIFFDLVGVKKTLTAIAILQAQTNETALIKALATIDEQAKLIGKLKEMVVDDTEKQLQPIIPALAQECS